ncbi:MAG: phage Gp37/Gp68 family protein [Kofleriaceae bacterium]|nr:phage Gp37/Gp68 family protein [Candidatus Methylomirabilis lanthanidiphila]
MMSQSSIEWTESTWNPLTGCTKVNPGCKFCYAERMTNQSLRERFHLGEDKAAIASQIIAATIEAGLIKADESVGGSRKFARYLPFWA